MATRIIPKTDLRDRIRSELADLHDDTIVVTERGRSVAVVVDVQRWNDLQLELEELHDRIAVLEHCAEPGAARSAEQVFAEIEAAQTEAGEADVSAGDRAAG